MKKTDRIENALGYLSENAVAGIEPVMNIQPAKRHLPARFIPLAAAFAVLLAVGAAAVGIRYFAPGVGIVDGEVEVLSAAESAKLGDIIVDSVMLTKGESGNTLTVWLYRENEVAQDAESARQGIPPEELSDLTAEINGEVYELDNWGGATAGYATYIFNDVADAESVTLRTKSAEARISLTDARASGKRGFIKSGNRTIELVKASQSDNIWAAELHDDFTSSLAGNGRVTSNASFAVKTGDGVGYMSGQLSLADGGGSAFGTVTVNGDTFGKDISYAALKTLVNFFSFDQNDETLPEVAAKVPAKGETLENGGILLERNGVIVRLKSVTNGENGIRFECEVENNSSEKFTSFDAEASGYVRQDIDYYAGSEHIVHENALTIVYGKNAYGETGAFRYDFETQDDAALPEGSEIIVKLKSLHVQYGVDGGDLKPNLGTTKLK